MKREYIKSRGRFFVFAALLLCAALLLSSCAKYSEKNDEVEALGRELIDHIIEDDFDSAFALVSGVSDEDTFRDVYENIRQALDGSREYTLKMNGWQSKTTGGITTHVASFEMTTDNGSSFQVDFGVREGVEGLYTFYITPISSSKLSRVAVVVFDVIIKAVSLGIIAFVIWMLIDCINRKIKLKAVWIIVLLLGISISLAISGSDISFGGFLGIMISTSDISMKYGVLRIKLLIPVGALVYFFLRKKLPSPNTRNPVPKTTETENNQENE